MCVGHLFLGQIGMKLYVFEAVCVAVCSDMELGPLRHIEILKYDSDMLCILLGRQEF